MSFSALSSNYSMRPLLNLSQAPQRASLEPTDSGPEGFHQLDEVQLSGLASETKISKSALLSTGSWLALGVATLGLFGAGQALAAGPAKSKVHAESTMHQSGREIRELRMDIGKDAAKTGKEIGKEATKVGKAISKEAGNAGKAISKEAAEVGKEIGRQGKELGQGVAKGAKDFWKGLTGKP